jgi:hypothetical protein
MEIMMLKSCFRQLEDALNELSSGLKHAPVVYAANKPGVFLTGLEGVSILQRGLTDLFYEDGSDDGRFTPICLGSVAAGPELIHLVIEANFCKAQLHAACRRFLENSRHKNNEHLSSAGKAKRLRAVLSDIGYGRVSLRQCYRQMHVLGETPERIQFSYSSGGSSIRKLTPAQAVALIDKAGMQSDQAIYDRDILSKMAPNTPLAQVQRLAGYYKANVFTVLNDDAAEKDGAAKKTAIQTIPAFLPIFYPYDESKSVTHQPLLPMSHMGRTADGTARSDREIGTKMIASSIRVYGYTWKEEKEEEERLARQNASYQNPP